MKLRKFLRRKLGDKPSKRELQVVAKMLSLGYDKLKNTEDEWKRFWEVATITIDADELQAIAFLEGKRFWEVFDEC